MTLPKLGRAFWRILGRRFLEAFGVLWLVYEPLCHFLPNSVPRGWGPYALLTALSGLFAIALAWPRQVVTATIPGADVFVSIRVGDLFGAKDNTIIGINDVFDTALGNIISTRSVQAQFLEKRLAGDVAALDRLVDQELKSVPFEPDNTKKEGKQNRYQIGTTIALNLYGLQYYLCAYCKMGSNLKAETDICSLITSLEQCWSSIRNTGQNRTISTPVLASDFGRIGLTKTQLVQIIVLSFVNANRQQHVAPGLTIYIHPSQQREVDMSALRLWLRGVLWA